MDLRKSAELLVSELLQLRSNEEVLIYGDSHSDMSVLNSVADAARKIGATALVLTFDSKGEIGSEPPRSVAAAMKFSDVLVEFSRKYLITTKAFQDAINAGARHLCLTGMDADMMTRLIGMVRVDVLTEFANKLAELTRRAKSVRIKSASGSDLFSRLGERPLFIDMGVCNKRGQEATLGGQISWAPIEESVEGTLVVDGSVWPPEQLGVLKHPVYLKLSKGRIVEIDGDREAHILRTWLEELNDPRMYNVAHFCYGFNPGARLSGKVLEDERVFGAFVMGIGSQMASFKGSSGLAKSHVDFVVLKPTILLDDVLLEKDGAFVHRDLAALSERLLRTP